jgi:PTH1 family peptidyl-tRNA hydrolase
VRLKRGGGAGGHNGLKDVIAHLGREFFRLRIGVGHPGRHNEVIDYVLANPGREENRSIRASIEEAADVMPVLLGQGEQPAMHRLHTRSQLDADASGDEG